MELKSGALDVFEILSRWHRENLDLNFGAIITFTGVVRDENGISGLSFDLYKPLLKKWFSQWQDMAKNQNAKILMAHSVGDVAVHSSSFIAGVLSPRRRVALDLIDKFVEDFKSNAPIWKYDIKNGERIYAIDRSKMIKGAGILS